MSRPSRALLITLAAVPIACGPAATSRDPKPVSPKPIQPVDGSAGGLPAAPVPTMHRVRAAVEAPHAGTIQVLTATLDATAVLTLDELGGARLWPSLDGTSEPRVVELPTARELALGTHATGYTAYVLDESRGLYIAKLDRSGRTLSHTTHGTDPAFAGMVMSPGGALAWRADHHVLLIDSDGKITDQLATQPQQRIVDIAVAGKRALAILDKAGLRQPRWLTLEPRLAWGDWVTPLIEGDVGTLVALAPDHKHIALSAEFEKKQHVAIVEVASGKQIAKQSFASLAEIRFADADLVAVGSGSGNLSWLRVSTAAMLAPTATPASSAMQRAQQLAAGNGRAITASQGQLMLLTPTDTQFLGYATLAPRIAQGAANGGVMLSVTGDSFHVLDAQLRATAKPNMSAPVRGLTSDLVSLGGDDWLVERAAQGGKSQVALIDIAKDSQTVVRDNLVEAHVLAYEPSTRLATLSFGSSPEVARFDPKARTLDRVATPKPLSAFEQTVLVPLAPKLARGMQLVVVSLRNSVEVKWVADARALDKPAATVTFDGAYAAADAAGHVYAWRNTNHKLELVIFTDGKQTGTLPTTGAATLWPNQTGTRIAELTQSAITIYQLDGKPVWTRELVGAQEALWLTDGALAITHASGVARLDQATGAITAARCGWGFGLSPKPHPTAPRIEPVCMQLLR